MFGVYRKVKLKLFQKKWRKLNKHNFIEPQSVFDSNLVEIGIGTCGHIDIISYGHKDEKLIIGNYCSIAEEVKFLLGGEHNFNNMTTFPFRILYLKQNPGNITKGPIIIGDDVWIGIGAIILSGVHIGNGAVVGAYTVVRRNVPPYAIIIGNPGRITGYRFTEEIIKSLEAIKPFDRLSLNMILKNIDLFEKGPSNDILDKIANLITPTNI